MATITASAAGGNWNTNAAWVGEVQPTAADDVVLAATSGNITVTTGAACRSLDATNYVKELKGANLDIKIGTTTSNGELAIKLGSGMTVSEARFKFVSTSGSVEKITTAGKALAVVGFEGTGGKWRLEDKLEVTSQLTLSRGELNTNGQEVKVGNVFTFSGNETRKLVLGASVIKLTGVASEWQATTITNLTFEAGTSTIELQEQISKFKGGGLTYNKVVFAAKNPGEITGSNTFATLELNTAGLAAVKFAEGTTQTITGSLTTNGTSSSLVKLASTVAGKQWTLKYEGSPDFLWLQDCKLEGGTLPRSAGDYARSLGNNTNWLFPAEETRVCHTFSDLGSRF